MGRINKYFLRPGCRSRIGRYWKTFRAKRQTSHHHTLFYMTVKDQIKQYITSLPEPKRGHMQYLHERILKILPGCRLWFDDGKNSDNKTVTNPTIGYGFQVMQYAGGKTRDFFQVGISANKTGISVYILDIKDKTYLAQTFGKQLGKASVTGYCIKFKTIQDIDTDVLEAAIRYGFEATGTH